MPNPNQGEVHLRTVLKRIYRYGMIGVTAALAILAYVAYRSSTAGTGDVLFSIVLGFLALWALLSIGKLDDRDRQAETYGEIGREFRARFPVRFRFASGSGEAPHAGAMLDWPSDTDRAVSMGVAEPEVHRVDGDLLHDLKSLADAGASIDELCRKVDPNHDSNDPLHQEAFRRLVQAMIEQA